MKWGSDEWFEMHARWGHQPDATVDFDEAGEASEGRKWQAQAWAFRKILEKKKVVRTTIRARGRSLLELRHPSFWGSCAQSPTGSKNS